MPDKIFIDTNILVYVLLNDNKDVEKREKLRNILSRDGLYFVSTQVINELFVSLLRHGLNDIEIRDRIKLLIERVSLSEISLTTIEHSWRIRVKYKYSYWDSLILASASDSFCSIVYTEDLQHNQVINDRLRIVNPLLIG